jgi:hypothetical protein
MRIAMLIWILWWIPQARKKIYWFEYIAQNLTAETSTKNQPKKEFLPTYHMWNSSKQCSKSSSFKLLPFHAAVWTMSQHAIPHWQIVWDTTASNPKKICINRQSSRFKFYSSYSFWAIYTSLHRFNFPLTLMSLNFRFHWLQSFSIFRVFFRRSTFWFCKVKHSLLENISLLHLINHNDYEIDSFFVLSHNSVSWTLYVTSTAAEPTSQWNEKSQSIRTFLVF